MKPLPAVAELLPATLWTWAELLPTEVPLIGTSGSSSSNGSGRSFVTATGARSAGNGLEQP